MLVGPLPQLEQQRVGWVFGEGSGDIRLGLSNDVEVAEHAFARFRCESGDGRRKIGLQCGSDRRKRSGVDER